MLLAPFVQPLAYAVVCSANGSKLVATVDAHDPGANSAPDTGVDHTAHCPLCLGTGAPPAIVARDAEPAQPLAHVLRPIPAAHLASLVGAPLPARGPPVLS